MDITEDGIDALIVFYLNLGPLLTAKSRQYSIMQLTIS